MTDVLERARAALVKPLVWKHHPITDASYEYFDAFGWGGKYLIVVRYDGSFNLIPLLPEKGVDTSYASLEAAQAAAQADYVARVLSALDLSKIDELMAAREGKV